MQSNTDVNEALSVLKKRIAKMAFNQQKTVDYSSWAILKMNNMVTGDAPSTDEKMYEMLTNKKHKDRILTHNNGPLLVYTKPDAHFCDKIADLIFADQAEWRKSVYNHFIEMQPGHEIGYNTLDKLRKIEIKLLSNDWLQGAIGFYDIINTDWLCNLMGLQQADERNFEKGMQGFATEVFRPSIASVESIGVGALQPSYEKDGYLQDFVQICEKASDLSDLLDKYYYKYGHIPLCYDYSLYSMLDSFFAKHSYNNQQRWDSLWQWADSKESPLSRYHVCCYFARNSNNVPEGLFQDLFKELLNIIYIPVENGNKLTWTLAWKLRCKTAKYFGQFLEVRLPGANSERIYSQAWWMTEKVASLYGNRSEDIAYGLENTISDEGNNTDTIWQMSRLKTQSSSLRYATVMTRSLWAVSVISQMDNKFMDHVCKNDMSNSKLFMPSVGDSLIGCFPLKSADETNTVYAYDVTCINAAEYLLQNHPDSKDEHFAVLVSLTKQLSDTSNLMTLINKISEQNHEDQSTILIAAITLSVKAFTDIEEDVSEIWETVCNEAWLDRVFSDVDDRVSYSIINSLIEIMLQKQDKWTWQLPHLFSIVYQKHINNDINKKDKDDKNSQRIKRFAFACVVISSICSDTSSALKRTLLKDRAGISELQKEWSSRLKTIYQSAPELTKSRLRPAILCLDL